MPRSLACWAAEVVSVDDRSDFPKRHPGIGFGPLNVGSESSSESTLTAPGKRCIRLTANEIQERSERAAISLSRPDHHGVRVPSVRHSALLVTHNVVRAHEGTTCWGFLPTLKWSTTVRVLGSIT